ncbi:hypothetical protein GQ457_08G024300 [Hibiscus cannabinus]
MLNAYWRFEMVSYCWVLVWDKFEWISGYFGCESDAKSSYNVELMFAASFDSKMGCLYSVFDVKKQGKTVWVVRARNWKLRGGENRLSGLLEGVSMIHGYEWYGIGKRNERLALRGAFLKHQIGKGDETMVMRTMRQRSLAWGKARKQGGSILVFVQVRFLGIMVV